MIRADRRERVRNIDELKDVVGTLAQLHRPSASEGEREAAEWIADRLRRHGCAVRVETEQAYGGFWWPVAAFGLLGAASGVLAASRRRSRRLMGLAGGAIAALGIADEATAGPYVFRRAFMRRRPTWNVIAEAGDREAEKTIVLLAHHDAAHSGLLFHPAVPKWLHEHFPERVEKMEESTPYWVAMVGAPVLVAAGALVGTAAGRLLSRLGALLGLVTAGLVADIGRRQVVPGANDNLSGVAVLVEVARALQAEPVAGIRVLLVSCGSEESLQEGILAFAGRHFDELPVESTSFLVVDSVASPSLLMIEAEGTLTMRAYSQALKSRLAAIAAERGISLLRGVRARSSTDGCIPNRHGYPTALLVSINEHRAVSNYHWPTDTAANADFETVADCAELSEALIRHLGAETAG